ncbi:MAG: hypothetical protein ACOC7L_04050, partial [Acidobacteriota bacterium]
PFLVRDPFKDRGWALEELWRERLERPDATLDDWRRRMEAGELPAAVFNSTVVETGEQLLLTPLTGFAPQAADFLSTYPGYDLPVATGARLSASFPWVSPVARPRTGEGNPSVTPPWHGADGGYYDNFGVVSLVSWVLSLDAAQIEELRRRGVVLVRIRAFPPAGALAEGGDDGAEPADRGWLYSAVGPLVTLLNVRTATQGFRNDVDVQLLTELAALKDIPVTCATFTLEAVSPLSWKLTDPQRNTIAAGWEEAANQEALCRVRKAFGHDVECQAEPSC